MFIYVLIFLMLIPEISEEEAEDLLQDAIHEKFAVFGDVCVIQMNLLQWIAYYLFFFYEQGFNEL